MLKLEHFYKPKKEVLILENNHEKIGLEEEFRFMDRPTCALLSALWTLCRLGIYKIPPGAIDNFNNKTFEAREIITILPERYKVVENKVLEIVKSTKFKDAVRRIKYEFF